MGMSSKRIAFFLPLLAGGGAERVVLNLTRCLLSRNIPVDLVLANVSGPYLNQIPSGTNVIDLASKRVIQACLPLAQYLQKEQPFALISHLDHANVIAIAARKLARTKTQLVVVEHTTLSQVNTSSTRDKLLPLFMKWLYPSADEIVGVSQGVSRDLEQQLLLRPGRVKSIYNPVVDRDLLKKAQAPLDHPWFQPEGSPVFLSVGRLTPEKDFSTLIEAFALVRQETNAKLIILGEGESRPELEATIARLKLTHDDVSLPGFVENPFAYMSHAKAFVLSSCREGLPTVLIEAMACGCPIISTDCPSGPREILETDKYGLLVPVGDHKALAIGMLETLKNPPIRDTLIKRAMDFSADKAVSRYLDLIHYP